MSKLGLFSSQSIGHKDSDTESENYREAILFGGSVIDKAAFNFYNLEEYIPIDRLRQIKDMHTYRGVWLDVATDDPEGPSHLTTVWQFSSKTNKIWYQYSVFGATSHISSWHILSSISEHTATIDVTLHIANKYSDKEPEKILQSMFMDSFEEIFEDGMDSTFTNRLEIFINQFKEEAILTLSTVISDSKTNVEAGAEALRLVGRIQHEETHSIRRWLLERNLSNPSVRIRDGAILGLSFLDDSESIPSIKEAIKKENYSELREDMQQVLKQLVQSESELYI